MIVLQLFVAVSIAALFAAMAAEQIKQRRAIRRRRAPKRAAPRKWIATRLRYLADRIDPHGAPRFTGYHFRIVPGRGIVFEARTDRGCPLWYLGQDDYEKAHR